MYHATGADFSNDPHNQISKKPASLAGMFSPLLEPLVKPGEAQVTPLPLWSLPHHCCAWTRDHQPPFSIDWLLH